MGEGTGRKALCHGCGADRVPKRDGTGRCAGDKGRIPDLWSADTDTGRGAGRRGRICPPPACGAVYEEEENVREILFRGKRLDTGEWVEGAYCPKNSDTPFGPMVERPSIIKLDEPYEGYWFDVDPNTVGQYTGMNICGKRIFEGDILKLDYIGPGRGVQGVAEVVFKYGKFCMPWGHRKELVPLDGFANTTMEIIGNIHDNQELLGGGE